MISVPFSNRARYSEYRDVRTQMLEYKGVNKTFDGRPALIDINLSIPEGATHALIGSSGSGKTTLRRITLGLVPFDKGYVKIDGQELLSFSPADWANRI